MEQIPLERYHGDRRLRLTDRSCLLPGLVFRQRIYSRRKRFAVELLIQVTAVEMRGNYLLIRNRSLDKADHALIKANGMENVPDYVDEECLLVDEDENFIEYGYFLDSGMSPDEELRHWTMFNHSSGRHLISV